MSDTETRAPPLFPLGAVVATRSVHLWAFEHHEGDDDYDDGTLAVRRKRRAGIAHAMHRHVTGDWGKVCAGDEGLNDQALIDGTRVFSVYEVEGVKLWIITEADRSSTTILFPEDY